MLRQSSLTAVAALMAMLLSLLLTACGFQLRGTATLPYDTLHLSAPATSGFVIDFRRAVAASSHTRIVENQKDAQATLHLVSETREKMILSLSGGGRVREYDLRYRITYRMIDKDNKELRPATQIALRRELSYNDVDTLSKESEEALLYRDMQTDAVSQVLRQLQTPQPVAAR
jgi:LPS-assembly lipoprotein